MPSTLKARRVTDTLYVDETAEQPPMVATLSGVVVTSDDYARHWLKAQGLEPCCVEDRISVSHGGPVLCEGH